MVISMNESFSNPEHTEAKQDAERKKDALRDAVLDANALAHADKGSQKLNPKDEEMCDSIFSQPETSKSFVPVEAIYGEEEARKKVPPHIQKTVLVSFRDGAYKKIKPPVEWKHSQWIHFTKPDGTKVMVNPKNVNYIEEFFE